MKNKTGYPLSKSLIILTSLVIDIFFMICADLTSFIIRFNGVFPPENFNAYLKLALFIIISRVLCFYVFGLYEKAKYKSNFEIFINTIKAATVSSIIIICLLYFLNIEDYPRLIAIFSYLLTIIFVTCWRLVLKEFINFYLGAEFLKSHLLIIGADKNAQEVAMRAMMDGAVEYQFMGFIKSKNNSEISVDKENVIGVLADLPELLKKYTVDEVILADHSLQRETLSDLVSFLNRRKIAIKSAPSAYDTIITNAVLSEKETLFIGPASVAHPASWYWGLKRILDIIAASAILVLTMPVIILAIIAIKITSPGPIFYFQKRIGKNGASFVIYKFRSMRLGAEKRKHPVWAKEGDERITLVGKLLRHYRIDELPQLINILKNDMSLIGPRPERPYFTYKLMRGIPFYAQRLQVKPGISGWAQVNFKYTNTEEDAKKKLLFDLYYIHNMSFTLDLLISLKSLKVVISGSGAH